MGKEMKMIGNKINELRISAFNNMAMVHLKEKNFLKVIEYCSKTIKSDRYSFKALLRRGRAYRHSKQPKKARIDLEFLQNNGYKYDLQIKNELKLLELNDFESDKIVIDEEEEKKKEKEGREKDEEEQKKKENETEEKLRKE